MTGLHDLLQKYVSNGSLPGAVALVARGDRTEVAAAGSMAVDGAPMARDSIFRIASVTKPITAAAVMMLVEDGKLTLDDPVDQWLPELAKPAVARTPASAVDDLVPAVRPITVFDLLTSSAGYGFASDFSLPAVQPLFQVQKDGREVQSFPAPDVWMAEVPAGKRDRFTSYYRTGPAGGLELADRPDGQWSTLPAFPLGNGGLAGTADDWSAFGHMLLAEGTTPGGRRILSAESVRLMTSDHTTESQREIGKLFLEGQGWGFGGSVDIAAIDPWNVPGRYGWVGGTGTSAHITASTGTVAILLAQVAADSPIAPQWMRDFWRYAASA
jgi:CubicO group peptidase (beta-lactamase class C family)